MHLQYCTGFTYRYRKSTSSVLGYTVHLQMVFKLMVEKKSAYNGHTQFTRVLKGQLYV